MADCNWQQDLDAHNVLIFRCTVCGKRVEICQQVIDRHYGGSIDPVLDAQPACGTQGVKTMPGVHRILACGPRAFNATLDQKQPANGKMPPITRRIGNYAKSIARWEAAGRPTRSPEEVARLYATCCQHCRHFKATKRSCSICGCRVRADGKAFLNKLAMGTERCPAPTPLWVEMPGFTHVKEESA